MWSGKYIFIATSLAAFFIFSPLWGQNHVQNHVCFPGNQEKGKTNTEIELPIAKPDPGDGDDWFEPIEKEKVVFVIDRSCSMAGSRLAKAKQELIKAIKSLPLNVYFSIVFYSCQVEKWKPQVVEATAENTKAAIGFVKGIEATGGTTTGPAVAQGIELDEENKLVILLTDGAPNCLGASYGDADAHLNHVLSKNTQKARVDVYAIQPWNGQYKQFCQSLAQKTQGKYKEVQ